MQQSSQPTELELARARKFGQVLRDARKRQHQSLEDVGLKSCISPQYLSNVETAYVHPTRGLNAMPDDLKIAALAKTLGLSVTYLHSLLGRTPEVAALVADAELLRMAQMLSLLDPPRLSIVRETLFAAARTQEYAAPPTTGNSQWRTF